MSLPTPSLKIAFVLSVIFWCYTPASGQREGEIRIDSQLVIVPVTVFDRDGRHISTLGRPDFRVCEDGIEQEIEYFETVEKPFTALLLLDRSGSMSGDFRLQLADAANVFVKQLRPDDQILAST